MSSDNDLVPLGLIVDVEDEGRKLLLEEEEERQKHKEKTQEEWYKWYNECYGSDEYYEEHEEDCTIDFDIYEDYMDECDRIEYNCYMDETDPFTDYPDINDIEF